MIGAAAAIEVVEQLENGRREEIMSVRVNMSTPLGILKRAHAHTQPLARFLLDSQCVCVCVCESERESVFV